VRLWYGRDLATLFACALLPAPGGPMMAILTVRLFGRYPVVYTPGNLLVTTPPHGPSRETRYAYPVSDRGYASPGARRRAQVDNRRLINDLGRPCGARRGLARERPFPQRPRRCSPS
jgi:hypothetical protein